MTTGILCRDFIFPVLCMIWDLNYISGIHAFLQRFRNKSNVKIFWAMFKNERNRLRFFGALINDYFKYLFGLVDNLRTKANGEIVKRDHLDLVYVWANEPKICQDYLILRNKPFNKIPHQIHPPKSQEAHPANTMR